MDELKKLISDKKARIGVIGAGYVGLPLALEFAKAKFKVICFEVDKTKVKKINASVSYIDDIKSKELEKPVKSKFLAATSDFSKLKQQDVILICVPTPLRKTKDPDVTYIMDAAKNISENLKYGQLIILESTTYPGTTSELIKPVFERTGLECGKDFCLAFSPERVDPGNKKYHIANTPKVVGGVTAKCGTLAKMLYSKITQKVIKVSSAESAEITKLVENTFRAVNIALANEIALKCDRLGLDVWEVLDACASKPFGYMPFYPGPGIGGHCIPLDPHYLGWKMKTLNFEPRFIELAEEINSYMPEFVVHKLAEVLNKYKKALSATKILVIGAAYKADISDERESPALDVIALLSKTGAKVHYFDPYVAKFEVYGKILKSIKLTPKKIAKYDCVIILTPHLCIDYKRIVKHSRLIFDTRNATKGIKSGKIFRL